MDLSISEQLQLLLFHGSVKKCEIAKALNMSPQSFSGKLRRGSFTLDELARIGELTGCRYVQYFELPNGQKLGFSNQDCQDY